MSGREWDADDKAGRYYFSGDGTAKFSAWMEYVPSQLRMTVCRYLTDADPAYETKGRLDFVKLDSDSSSWIALSYCVFFADGIVGVIQSTQGPTPAQVSSYVQEKAEIGNLLELGILTYRNIATKLKRMKFVSRISASVQPGSLFFPEVGASAGDVELALSAGAQMKDAKIFKFVLEAKGKNPLHGVKDTVLRLLGESKINSQSTLTFDVTGPDEVTNNNIPIDLLRANISISKQVELQNKALNPESAYRAVAAAYAENLTELHQLPSVQIRDADST